MWVSVPLRGFDGLKVYVFWCLMFFVLLVSVPLRGFDGLKAA